MNTSRLITGIAAITIGAVLLLVAASGQYFVALYGLPIAVIGIVILMNRNEDTIESIKKRK